MTTVKQQQIKQQKSSLYVLLTYIFIFQLSSVIFFIPAVRSFAMRFVEGTDKEKLTIIGANWSFFVGIISLLIILWIVLKNRDFLRIYKGEKATIPQAIGWGVIGFFLVFFGQSIAAYVETVMFGIEAGSQNTASLVEIAKIAPLMILVIALIGPILEEFVFRRVVFGSLVQVQSFWVSAIVSGVVFAAIHFEFSHILLYTTCGLIFAYLYHKTKRLLTSIISHILLNSFVVFMNLNIDKIQKLMETLSNQ